MHKAYIGGRFQRTKTVLPPEIVMHDANISGRSENNIKCVLREDLGQKNRTIRYILPHHWLYE